MNEHELAAGLAPTANYRLARLVGTRLYVAGQVPHDAKARIVGIGDPTAQAAQCLKNLFLLIGIHGFDRGDIRQLVIYVVGGRDNLSLAWKAVEDAFEMDVPPATLLGVTVLGYEGQRVEIDATIEKEPDSSGQPKP